MDVATQTQTPAAAAQPTSAMYGDNAMKLGIFCLNISGGMVMSEAAPNVLSWPDTVAVAQAADAAGWEFLLSLGRWRGHGGRMNANAEQYETFTWAAGMAAVTQRIHLFVTCHIPVFHPMLAAKMAATIDAISAGRVGLNLVAGNNALEFGMFGIDQREHEDRYAAAEEWLMLVERLWTEQDEVDWEGKYYTVRRGYLQPKPVQRPRPLIVSAGTSGAGLDFALKHSDYSFQGGPDLDIVGGIARRTEARAQELGVRGGRITFAPVVLADTEAEAWRYFEWYVDELGDLEAAQNQIRGSMAGGSQSFSPEVHLQMARYKVAGWGGMPLVGTAEQIVERLVAYKELGYDGIALGWVDMAQGLAEFNEKVLPLMVEAGLRSAP
ncbi:LLM class flavin-dependent oxidoreductase [Pseudonocardia halophobica]|uniref:Alkanesulfonate monooxygenase n=1 Tax=Pseudonocardia halophobica TaxID=29401 RepID=A0A9W6LA15_9PSEU|nr:LLM class flavin-dependent oxidoreductase [Pseudonocardia halophobica]GLL14465.1 alkanesulfonate monooxygenase [Pseudonocardia halophobica]